MWSNRSADKDRNSTLLSYYYRLSIIAAIFVAFTMYTLDISNPKVKWLR